MSLPEGTFGLTIAVIKIIKFSESIDFFNLLGLTCCVSTHFDDAFALADDFSVIERANPNRYFYRRHCTGLLLMN